MVLPSSTRFRRQNRQLKIERLEHRKLLAADLVLTWNNVMLDAIRFGKTPPPIASRAMAIVQTAIYDSVNAIDRTHSVYAVDLLASPTTSREAAVSAAAHATLVSLFPAQKAKFDTQYQADLAAIPNGQPEDLGVSLGNDVAKKMLELRKNDGANVVVPYLPGNKPGDWIPTPPGNAPALLPQWPNVTPFAMKSGSQFTPHGIPALNSKEYADALNEVKAIGSATSTTRTADQTNIALFWANGGGTATPPGHLNIMAQKAAIAEDNTLSENARLFAELNVALADAAIMAWDAKYDTNFWRPITAIRAADTDGNASTVKDVNWNSLIATPPFPTYVSGHSSFSGAAAAVLRKFFGFDQFKFTLPSEDSKVPNREFTSFSQAAQESTDSRMFGGIHFRFDNEDGLKAGGKLGEYVAANFFKPQDRGPAAGLVGNILVVVGSDSGDFLTMSQGQGKFTVKSFGQRLGAFNIGDVKSIVISARSGNDFVELGNEINVAATIFGGDGNDFLIGGGANDSIFGEDGHDILFGMMGDDLLDGGDGDDILYGGPGEDILLGRRGRNLLFQ